MSHVLRNASVRLVAMLLSRSLPWTSLLVLLCLIATPALAVTYSDNGDGTVTDPTTGLTWMRCAMGQTWDGSTCTGTGSTYTWDQANALTGTVTFAGQSDWRVPNIRELQTIVDRSTYMPAIDSAAFPNTSPARFWSASDDSFYDQNKDFMPDYGWGVDFHYASMYGDLKDSVNQVRLVRSGQSSALLNVARPTSDYVDHGDGTVTHTPTGLMWKRCAEGQTWQASNCNGTATTFTWDAAIAATDAFAGKSDWRLPTVDELLSLVDYTTHKYSFNGAINETIFRDVYPGSPGGTGMFWSASEYANNSAYAWYVNLGADGGDGAGKKSDTPHRNVFLVRAGFGTFDLTVTKTGSGTISAPARINCGNTCTADFGKGFAVALTAAPTGNFIGWGGACSGTGATCTVTMNAAQNVTANFKVAPIVVALPANLSFANQNLGTTSAAQTVTLSNTGGAPFNLSSIVASGDFAVTHDCGTGLGAGGFCALTH